jgi:hypothetical protein
MFMQYYFSTWLKNLSKKQRSQMHLINACVWWSSAYIGILWNCILKWIEWYNYRCKWEGVMFCLLGAYAPFYFEMRFDTF